jgi:hypothetical protein
MFRTIAYVLCLSGLVWGPATGAALAIHHAHAGPHHQADNCPICIQLTVGAAAPVIDPPTLIAPAETLFFKSACAGQLPVVAAHERTPLAPRAPPLS